jgi:hypothetical protein
MALTVPCLRLLASYHECTAWPAVALEALALEGAGCILSDFPMYFSFGSPAQQ